MCGREWPIKDALPPVDSAPSVLGTAFRDAELEAQDWTLRRAS
jgi:hypothetical protein